MKKTLLLAVLFLSLNSEGASATRSVEDIAAIAAARREAISAKRREWRKANQEKIKAQEKARRDDPKIGARIKAQKKASREANQEKITAQEKAYRAANQEKRNAQLKAWRDANRERRNAQQKGYRDAAKLKRALSWHVGGKPEPLGDKDKVEPVDLAGFAFGAGAGAHLDFLDKKRPRANGAKGGPATKPKTA